MPRAFKRSRSSFSPPPKKDLIFDEKDDEGLLPSFSPPEELSPAAPADEDAEAQGTTRYRDVFPPFSAPEAAAGRRRREEAREYEEVEEVDVVADLDCDGDGRMGARSLRAGAAALALLGAATSVVPRTGAALVIVERISLLGESGIEGKEKRMRVANFYLERGLNADKRKARFLLLLLQFFFFLLVTDNDDTPKTKTTASVSSFRPFLSHPREAAPLALGAQH